MREYYPAALVAFEDLAHGDALGVLGRAPTPEQGCPPEPDGDPVRAQTRWAPTQYRCPRPRNPGRTAHRAARRTRGGHRGVRAPPPAPRSGIIAELNRQIGELEAELATHFEAHPDADIYRSLPGLGVVLGARVLGEFGDDPNRYTDAKCRKNYAGTSPLTVASGKKRAVLARHVRNRRLYDAVDQWALGAITQPAQAREPSTTSTCATRRLMFEGRWKTSAAWPSQRLG